MQWRELVWVGLGGGIGSMLRYLVTRLCQVWQPAFPLGTLLVNLIGCGCAGLLLGLAPQAGYPPWKLLLLTGLLGGFTTFSAFSLETYNLWQTSARAQAGLNLTLNLCGSLLCAAIGHSLGLWIASLAKANG